MQWWERDDLLYIDGRLHLGGVDCQEVAKEFGTPLYLYHGNRFLQHGARLRSVLGSCLSAPVRIQFMCKANPAPALLDLWSRHGEREVIVSSPFEARLALRAGASPDQVTFYAGLGTTDEVFSEIAHLGVSVVLDCFAQIDRVSRLGIREASIRWNPGVGVGNVPAAGRIAHGDPMQFGIPEDRVLEAFSRADTQGLRLKGLTQHVGSQVIRPEEIRGYFESITRLIKMAREIETAGHQLEYICFGGGISVRYAESDPEFPLPALAEHIARQLAETDLHGKSVGLEPGRYLTADMGLLIARVTVVEEKYGTTFVGVDTGVNHMPRRILHPRYQTPHEIAPCLQRDTTMKTTVCGTLLFTADNLGTQVIPTVEVGDYVAFLNMGAYTGSLKFHFGWPFAAEAMVLDGAVHVVRRRETFDHYLDSQGLVATAQAPSDTGKGDTDV